MDCSTQFNFAFDVDNIPFAQTHGSRDPNRVSERRIAERCRCEAVYLPLHFTGCVDQQDLFKDCLLRFAFYAIRSV